MQTGNTQCNQWHMVTMVMSCLYSSELFMMLSVFTISLGYILHSVHSVQCTHRCVAFNYSIDMLLCCSGTYRMNVDFLFHEKNRLCKLKQVFGRSNMSEKKKKSKKGRKRRRRSSKGSAMKRNGFIQIERVSFASLKIRIERTLPQSTIICISIIAQPDYPIKRNNVNYYY